MIDITYIHATAGLCPVCQVEWDEDPGAYLEYGEHPAGIERWREFQAQVANEVTILREWLDDEVGYPF